VAIKLGRRCHVRRLYRARDTSREAIASAGDIDDVTFAIVAVAERAAKRGNMDTNIGFINECVRPNETSQFFLFDNFAGAL
jgi:hypothetical protein